MTSNKQPTSVEWQFEQLFNSFEKFNNGEYTFDEFLSTNLRIREQAKEKYEHEMCVFAHEYASYVQEQSKEGIKGAMVSMCAWIFFKNRRR
jgi:hypothetical protein